jgi:hypothetical protein
MLLAVFVSFFRSQKHARILPDIANKSRGEVGTTSSFGESAT